MTKSMVDVREYVRELRKNNQVASIAPALAADFQRRMAECLTERELVGVDYLNSFVYNDDPGVCGSHDYLDANMVMFDAAADYCERVIGLPRDIFERDALSAEEMESADDAVLTLFNTGWDEAKKQGFSKTWRDVSDHDFRKDVGLLVLRVPASATGSHPLEEEISSEFEAAYERVVGANGDLRSLAHAVGDGNNDDVGAFVEAVKNAQALSLVR